jgi:DNA-binding transcriptional MerR regulator
MEKRFWPVHVGRQFDRSAAWVKLVERQGIIPPARRDFAGRRFYLAEDVQRIREILADRYKGASVA